MKRLIYGLLLVLIPLELLAQNEPSFQLIQIAESGNKNYPLMEIVPDTSAVFKSVDYAVRESFMGQAIKLFHLAQTYLINTSQLITREPAYLGITQNEGGFARKGFRLKTPESIIEKPGAYYVDLTASSVTAKLDRLTSISQLYPHELGHVMYRLLSSSDSLEQEGKSVTVHYFSLITDNSIAFNEGFAEHIENIARLYEKNDSIKLGIEADVAAKEPNLQRSASAFVRDYTWPLRLDYYKATMIVWFQQFEDYKRYKHSLEGLVTSLNGYPELDMVQDMMSIRNAGVITLPEKRNKAQLMASEGFVSAFFSRLATKGLGKSYRQPEFYKLFLRDTTEVIVPEERFNEVENLFIKYFFVMNRHMQMEQTDRAQFMDFMDGYVQEFPEDASLVKSVYKELTNEEYTSFYPPSLWLMVKGYHHRILALDALGAITLPVYTFNLNAADKLDVMTIPGIDDNLATAILEERDQRGYFSGMDEVLTISRLSAEAKDGLNNAAYDESFVEGLDLESLDIGILIKTPLIHLLRKGSLIFIAIFAISFMMVLRVNAKPLKAAITFVKYYFIWLLLVAGGLISIIIQGNPVIIYLVLLIFYYLAGYLILRKKIRSLKHFILISFMMNLVVIYSLI